MKFAIQKSFLLTILSLLSPSIFAAGNITTNNQVNATLSSSCSISTYNINFMDTNTTGSNSGHNVTVVCSKGIAYSIVFGPGSSGDMLNRTMIGTVHGDKLNYKIIKNITTTPNPIMGDGTNGTYLFTGVGTGVFSGSVEIVQLIAGQYVTPDDYIDTVTVAVNY